MTSWIWRISASRRATRRFPGPISKCRRLRSCPCQRRRSPCSSSRRRRRVSAACLAARRSMLPRSRRRARRSTPSIASGRPRPPRCQLASSNRCSSETRSSSSACRPAGRPRSLRARMRGTRSRGCSGQREAGRADLWPRGRRARCRPGVRRDRPRQLGLSRDPRRRARLRVRPRTRGAHADRADFALLTGCPAEKAYRYVKAKDEITATALPKKDLKERYASVVHQVALRTLHEIFEADRAGKIQTITLQVATDAKDPATGLERRVAFVGVGAERDSFMTFDLHNIVPAGDAGAPRRGGVEESLRTRRHRRRSRRARPMTPSGLRVQRASRLARSPAATGFRRRGGRRTPRGLRAPDGWEFWVRRTAAPPPPPPSRPPRACDHNPSRRVRLPPSRSHRRVAQAGDDALRQRISELEAEVARLRADALGDGATVELDDERVLQEVGIYRYHHPLENAAEYKDRAQRTQPADQDHGQGGRRGAGLGHVHVQQLAGQGPQDDRRVLQADAARLQRRG